MGKRSPYRLEDLGRTYGRLRVVGPIESRLLGKRVRRFVWCECGCGDRHLARLSGLVAGRVRSCGCDRAAGLRRHNALRRGTGVYRSAEYRTWERMKARCYRSDHRGYRHYGGRGIAVCARWLGSFAAFLSDMGVRPAGCSIERLDVNGDYEPGNCVWADKYVQALNKRTTRWVEVAGRRVKLADLCRERGLDLRVVGSRLRLGWSVAAALGRPVVRRK